MHEDGFVVRRPLGAEFRIVFSNVEIAIHEVGDDFDGALNVEVSERLIEKIL